MNKSFPVVFSRFISALCLLAFMGLVAVRAGASTPDPRLYGPWIVQDSVAQENIGLQVYFSPDGNFRTSAYSRTCLSCSFR